MVLGGHDEVYEPGVVREGEGGSREARMQANRCAMLRRGCSLRSEVAGQGTEEAEEGLVRHGGLAGVSCGH